MRTPIEPSQGATVADLRQFRTESPQLVSKDIILWSMDAMQLREVGNLVVQPWEMRWLRGPSCLAGSLCNMGDIERCLGGCRCPSVDAGLPSFGLGAAQQWSCPAALLVGQSGTDTARENPTV